MMNCLRILFCTILIPLVHACHYKDRSIQFPALNSHKHYTIALVALDNTPINSTPLFEQAFAHYAPYYQLNFRQDSSEPQNSSEPIDFYLKGYFSLLYDDMSPNAILLYVFDVLDQNGFRLHRIEDRQEIALFSKAQMINKDSLLSAETCRKIAQNIFNNIQNWLQNQNPKS